MCFSVDHVDLTFEHRLKQVTTIYRWRHILHDAELGILVVVFESEVEPLDLIAKLLALLLLEVVIVVLLHAVK